MPKFQCRETDTRHVRILLVQSCLHSHMQGSFDRGHLGPLSLARMSAQKAEVVNPSFSLSLGPVVHPGSANQTSVVNPESCIGSVAL